ncbi:MAG: hypothetical protein K2O22_01520, partial [Anaeroplasmataceae bacterium]|nr:hypothetical protein [Anaeroplasmataceae bacterium]
LTQTDSYYKFSNKYGANRKLDVKVCIMPTIEITDDLLTVIPRNSIRTSTDANNKTYKTSLTSRDKIDLKIDKDTLELLVNGKKLAPTMADGSQSPNTFKVEMPTISFDKEGYVNVNGIDTTIPMSNFDVQDIFAEYKNVSVMVVPYDASYYVIDKVTSSIPTNGYNTSVRLSNPSICPDITTSGAGNCVIDGYYTTFKYNTSAFKTAPTLKVDSDYNLIIGGVTTDYRVSLDSISTTTGGIVKQLTIHAKIFLLMLCLLSIPLMRLLQAIVPWFKRQIAFVQKILSKF